MAYRKRPQLRRCRACSIVGHNRATCPKEKVQKAPVFAAPPKFFVHHVKVEPPTSPHVIDLKNEHASVWHAVDSKSASTPAPSAFHSYHEQTAAPAVPVTTVAEPVRTAPAAPQQNTIPLPAQPLNTPSFAPDAPIEKTWRDFFHSLFPLKPALAALVLIVALVTVPSRAKSYYESLRETKAVIAENSTDGFLALQQSTTLLKTADLDGAAEATALAESKFHTALATLESKHRILQTLISAVPVLHGELQSREKILLAGQEIAIGNGYLLTTLRSAKNNPKRTPTESINELTLSLGSALPNYNAAIKNLNEVSVASLPTAYQEQFKDFRTLFTALVTDLKSVAELGGTFQEIFGGSGQRRYLLVFQNPHELRATGGFMGSFAVLDIKDGQLVKLDIPAGGTYDLQGQLSEYVIPPLPLTLSNKRWEFQDANWFPDFPASAQKMLWFYNHSRSVTADGVIAINATVLERLLGIIGPVNDDKRNLALTKDNAVVTIQSVVETGSEKKNNKPKQILSDLTPALFSAITSTPPSAILPLLVTLEEALAQKEIQAYFSDEQSEAAVRSFGWDGSIITTPANTDYLLAVNTNVQGEKSDAKIKQTISHQATVDEDGTITDTVLITREHTGTPGEQLYGKTNIDYLRLYVPAGSTLLSASGFTWPDEKSFRASESWYAVDSDLQKNETNVQIDNVSGTRISNEFNKTSFGNWIITAPGTISQVLFTYRLPFKLASTVRHTSSLLDTMLQPLGTPVARYALTVQKQSGIESEFESQVLLPASWQTAEVSADNIVMAENGFRIPRQTLNRDILWSAILKTNS